MEAIPKVLPFPQGAGAESTARRFEGLLQYKLELCYSTLLRSSGGWEKIRQRKHEQKKIVWWIQEPLTAKLLQYDLAANFSGIFQGRAESHNVTGPEVRVTGATRARATGRQKSQLQSGSPQNPN